MEKANQISCKLTMEADVSVRYMACLHVNLCHTELHVLGLQAIMNIPVYLQFYKIDKLGVV